MSLESQLKRLERRVDDLSDFDDGLIPIDFGPWLGVISVPPNVVDDIARIYGDKNGGHDESKVAA